MGADSLDCLDSKLDLLELDAGFSRNEYGQLELQRQAPQVGFKLVRLDKLTVQQIVTYLLSLEHDPLLRSGEHYAGMREQATGSEQSEESALHEVFVVEQ